MFKKDYEAGTCPYLQGPCIEGKCRFWVHLMGQHPQTGAQIDKFDCAVALVPLMLIENSNQQRMTGAAIESFRNEMVEGNKATGQLLAHSIAQNMGLIGHG